MNQIPLIVDSMNDAIRDTIRTIGGSKRVGPQLWPTLKPEAAERRLDDSLNPDRPHKLDIEEVLAIARLGREKGVHLIAGFLCMDVGYAPPVPVDPDDQRAELQRKFNESVDSLGAMLRRLERTAAR